MPLSKVEQLKMTAGLRPLHLKLWLSEEDRALIERAAAQSHGWSVTTWAEQNLVDLARVEMSGS